MIEILERMDDQISVTNRLSAETDTLVYVLHHANWIMKAALEGSRRCYSQLQVKKLENYTRSDRALGESVVENHAEKNKKNDNCCGSDSCIVAPTDKPQAVVSCPLSAAAAASASKKYTLTAPISKSISSNAETSFGHTRGSGGITLAFKDIYATALLKQRSSLKSLRNSFAALQCDVSHHATCFKDDMILKHQVVVLCMEKLRCLHLASLQTQGQHRRQLCVVDSSMSDVLTSEKISTRDTSDRCRSRSANDNNFSSILKKAFFPSASPRHMQQLHSSSAVPSSVNNNGCPSALEVIWQCSFSRIQLQQECRAGAEGVNNGDSPPFVFAGQLWKIRCCRNDDEEALDSSKVSIVLPTTFDIKLVRILSEGSRTDTSHLNGQEVNNNNNSQSAAAVASGAILKCEFRLQGNKLLGKTIIRKLYTDTGSLYPTHDGNINMLSTTSIDSERMTGVEQLFAATERHVVEEAMLLRFLKSGRLAISILLQATLDTEQP